MRVTLLGAGHIGQTIARLLAGCGDYEVTVVDRSPEALALVAPVAGVRTALVETSDAGALRAALQRPGRVVNALPYHLCHAGGRRLAPPACTG